jgi:Helix-turn-helix domain
MSWKVLNWVSENSPTKGSARLLLVMMADMANDEGWLEAKNSTLAARCNVDSERAVQKQIFALAKAGAIQVIHQAADSGRSLNNAFVVLTPGRAIPELRSKAPRVSKRSPSPNLEPSTPRANDRSPSHPVQTDALHPVQTDTLTPSESSPSPRPNVHPHKRTVLQEPSARNQEQQQQQQAAREAARPGSSAKSRWIDFNPRSEIQRLVVSKIEELTPNGTADERRAMLRTLSATPDENASLEGSLRQASAKWLGMTLATAARFERENVDDDATEAGQ